MSNETIARHWQWLQEELLPVAREKLGELPARHQRLAVVLNTVNLEHFFPYWRGVGRPEEDRIAIARCFIAKAVFNFSTTRLLVEMLKADQMMRRLCGFEKAYHVPHESTFSRAFAEFTKMGLPAQVHELLIKNMLGDKLCGHVSRDSTAIEAREKAVRKAETKPQKQPRKKGRPCKDAVQNKEDKEESKKQENRIEKQLKQSLKDILFELPKDCDIGSKRHANGFFSSWKGYKFHIDTIDGDIPVCALLTAASLHDSQVDIPLRLITSQRFTYLYELKDAAYDSEKLAEHCEMLGHKSITDVNPRRDKELKEAIEKELKASRSAGFVLPEDVRYRQRSSVERTNSNLKDNYGGRSVRVRGHAKVYAHLMFGILSIAALQLMRMIS